MRSVDGGHAAADAEGGATAGAALEAYERPMMGLAEALLGTGVALRSGAEARAALFLRISTHRGSSLLLYVCPIEYQCP